MVKSMKDLPPFEEWGLSESVVDFLHEVEATPEGILGFLRKGNSTWDAEELSWRLLVDMELWSKETDIEDCMRHMLDKTAEELVDLLSGWLSEYVWKDDFQIFQNWMSNCFFFYMGDYFPFGRLTCNEEWFELVNELYEKVNEEVDEKIEKIIEACRNDLTSGQLDMFSFALRHWHTYSVFKYYEYSDEQYEESWYVLGHEEYKLLMSAIRNVDITKIGRIVYQ